MSNHLSSPRPWGCFQGAWQHRRRARVFPTPVGVFPAPLAGSPSGSCLPHARGGVSVRRAHRGAGGESSPRPWGCFHLVGHRASGLGVFPTPVGVFPAKMLAASLNASLPHARGGVSKEIQHGPDDHRSSPRPWGCFLSRGIFTPKS